MANEDPKIWMEKLSQSLVKGHRLMDPTAWTPPNPFLLDPLFEDLWLYKIQELKTRAQEKKLNFETLAESIMGPGCIRKEFRWALWGMKLMNWPIDKRLDIITFYRNILEAKSPKDPFNFTSALWHTPQEITQITTQTTWQKVTTESKRLVGQLSANCPPLAWGLFTDFFYHRAYEVYGLYGNLDSYDKLFLPRDQLMIRQFGPFNAPELWSHTKNYPQYKIIIKAIYRDLTCDFDYINHFTTHDNLYEKLAWYSIEVDGKEVNDLDSLRQINQEIMESAIEQDDHLKKLDNEGQKIFTTRAKYYALKELFEKTGMSWEPDENVIKRITNKPLLKINFSKMDNQKEIEGFWRELFDPYHPFVRPELLAAQKQIQAIIPPQ